MSKVPKTRLRPDGLADLRSRILNDFRVDRRDFLVGAVSSALLPAAKGSASLVGLFGFRVIHDPKSASVILTDGSSWTLDTRVFAGRPVLHVVETEHSAVFRLIGARFPGTEFPFEIEAKFLRSLTRARVEFRFSKIGPQAASLDLEAPLREWIGGAQSASGPFDLRHLSGRLNQEFHLEGSKGGTVAFSCDGALTFSGDLRLIDGKGGNFDVAQLSISASLRSPTALVAGRGRALTRISARKRGSWPHPFALASTSGWRVGSSHEAYDDVEIEAHENGTCAISFQGAGVLTACLNDELSLELARPQFAHLRSAAGSEMRFEADPSPEAQWIHRPGLSVGLASAAGESLVLQGATDGSISGQPKLLPTQIAASMNDAFVSIEPAEYPVVARDTQIQGLPNGGKTKGNGNGSGTNPIQGFSGKHVGTTTATSAPSPYENQYENLNFVGIQLNALTVLRQSDFVNLRFEFVNLQINLPTKANGTASLGRQSSSQPAFIVVEFAPQALTDQVYQTNNPDAATSLPVDTILAGTSRLVFYVHPTQSSINFALEGPGGLLDWSNWGLLVMPTASSLGSDVQIQPGYTNPIQSGAVTMAPSKRSGRLAMNEPPGLWEQAKQFLFHSKPLPAFNTSQALPKFMAGRPKTTIVHYYPGLTPGLTSGPDPTKIIPAVPNGVEFVDPYHTTIEMPVGLYVSPDETARWFHATTPSSQVTKDFNGNPVTVSGLWVSHLGVPGSAGAGWLSDDGSWFYQLDAKGQTQVVRNPNLARPSIRAIGTAGGNPVSGYPCPTSVQNDLVANMCVRSTNPQQDSAAVTVERLMLSSFGGFLKSHWTRNGNGPQGSTAAWRHETGLGRVNYDYVVTEGYLYPTGHPATVITTSHRRFVQPGAVVAELVQTQYLIVREQTVSFSGQNARALGFQSIALGVKRMEVVVAGPWLIHGTGAATPIQFPMRGIDMDGNPIGWTQPLAFVSAGQSAPNISAFGIDMGGQHIAFGQTSNPEDGTAFPCTLYMMTGTAGAPSNAMVPKMASASIHLPAVNAFNAPGAPPANVQVSFDPAYVQNGFQPNTPEVFLDVFAASQISFGTGVSEKFGGIVNPTSAAHMISRKHGPIPTPDSSGHLSPASFASIGEAGQEYAEIGGVGAGAGYVPNLAQMKLLGTVSIESLLPNTIDLTKGGPDCPKVKATYVRQGDTFGTPSASTANPIVGFKIVFDWNVNLAKNIPNGTPLFIGNPALISGGTLPPLPPPLPGGPPPNAEVAGGAVLSVQSYEYTMFAASDATGASAPGTIGGPIAAGKSYLSKAGIYYFNVNADGQLNVYVDTIEFDVQSGQSPVFKIYVPSLTFMGNLSFCQTLQTAFGGNGSFYYPSQPPSAQTSMDGVLQGGDDDQSLGFNPILNVTPVGVTAGFQITLPSLGMGFFTLMNISALAEIKLPWLGPSMLFEASFCTRANPFMISVYGIGGGGFIGVTLDSNGLRTLEGQFEIGICVAIDLGVAGGSVSLMAGIYFQFTFAGEGVKGDAQITGFIQLSGSVQVLSLVSVSITLYVGITFDFDTDLVYGTGTISFSVSLLCWSASFSVSYTKEIPGGSLIKTALNWVDDEVDPSALMASTHASMQRPAPAWKPTTPILFSNVVSANQFAEYCGAFGG